MIGFIMFAILMGVLTLYFPKLKGEGEQENQQQQQTKDLIQALEIWNVAGCSVRDICTPVSETAKILDQTPKIEMDVYPKTLSFCYIEYNKVHGEKVPFVVCNYVEMSNKKLKEVRDFLDDYSDDK
jgi:hypothetical protein